LSHNQNRRVDDQNLAMFEKKVLQQFFGPSKNQKTGEYDRRKNEELISLLEHSDIIAIMKSKRISWAGNVW